MIFCRTLNYIHRLLFVWILWNFNFIALPVHMFFSIKHNGMQRFWWQKTLIYISTYLPWVYMLIYHNFTFILPLPLKTQILMIIFWSSDLVLIENCHHVMVYFITFFLKFKNISFIRVFWPIFLKLHIIPFYCVVITF